MNCTANISANLPTQLRACNSVNGYSYRAMNSAVPGGNPAQSQTWTQVQLFERHLPYHESDHVLNLGYNALLEGVLLEDIELRRNDEASLDGLGAQRNQQRAETLRADFGEGSILDLQEASMGKAAARGSWPKLREEIRKLAVDLGVADRLAALSTRAAIFGKVARWTIFYPRGHE